MRAALTIVNVLLLGSGLIGCFDFLSNAQDFQQGKGGASGAGDAGGIGGTGGTSTATSPPPECVPSGTSKAVDESCGLFVSPGGSDATGDGTQKHPYATITKALSQGQVVYACADAAKPYDEAITVDKQGTYIFGGLDCGTWIYKATNRTPLMASPGEIPLRIVGDAALQIEDFAITAADAPELMPGQHAAGASSIAIIAEATSTLEMARCEVSAGRGAMGAHGEPPMGSAASGPDGEDGAGGCDADGELPGNGGQQMCGSTDVSGGLGGQGTKLSSGGKGSGGQPVGPLGLGGQPQPVAVTCDQGGNGGTGADGLAGEHGKGAAADALGSISAAGFLGTRGPDGMPGQPAQGGGGGGGARVCLNGKAGPSGGGGGAGGCGGAGGKGGYPGGASIGIVSLGATLLFNDVTIKAGDGGNGGSGEGGQDGGAGGTGGVPGPGDSNAIACGGGKGGTGGGGGAGGGGRGGHSIGVAHSGAVPSTEGTTILLGIPGDGGKGFGLLPEHNGASGVAKPVQAF